DPHACLEQAVFGEDRPQCVALGGVPAVERGQGEQLRFDRHGGGAWRKPRILLRLPASSLVGAAGAASSCSFSSISRSGQRQGLAASAAPTGTSVAAAYPDGLTRSEEHTS